MEIDPPPPPAAAQGGEASASASAIMATMTAEESALQCASDHDLRVAYYCEENVWRLAYRMRHHNLHGEDARFWVVFISNVIKNVPFFHQRASEDPNKSVCWDYHVILIGNTNTNTSSSRAMQHHDDDDEEDDNINGETAMMLVYDIDSRLPYPCPLHQYLQQSFPYEWPEPYNPMFRVIPADLFLSHFSSDRSHMINSQTGEWNAPPPNYAPIITGGGSSDDAAVENNNNNNNNNLQHYLNFVGRPHHRTTEIDEEALGQILNKQQLAAAEFARD